MQSADAAEIIVYRAAAGSSHRNGLNGIFACIFSKQQGLNGPFKS